MSGIAVFSTAEIHPLLDELAKASGYKPCTDDIFDPSLYPDGVVRNTKGQSEEEAEAAGELFWPDQSRIDRSKLGPALVLEGNHGLYLVNNADIDQPPSERGMVAYAKGCKPGRDEDFYLNKEAICGGDDRAMALPVEWFIDAIQAGKKEIKLRLTEDSVAPITS